MTMTERQKKRTKLGAGPEQKKKLESVVVEAWHLQCNEEANLFLLAVVLCLSVWSFVTFPYLSRSKRREVIRGRII